MGLAASRCVHCGAPVLLGQFASRTARSHAAAAGVDVAALLWSLQTLKRIRCAHPSCSAADQLVPVPVVRVRGCSGSAGSFGAVDGSSGVASGPRLHCPRGDRQSGQCAPWGSFSHPTPTKIGTGHCGDEAGGGPEGRGWGWALRDRCGWGWCCGTGGAGRCGLEVWSCWARGWVGAGRAVGLVRRVGAAGAGGWGWRVRPTGRLGGCGRCGLLCGRCGWLWPVWVVVVCRRVG